MHEYEITKSSLLPLHPFVQRDPQREPSDQVSKASVSSCGTVHRDSGRKSSLSASSQRSSCSIRLRVRNENVPLNHNASQCSLPATPTPISISSARRKREDIRERSSWDNELPRALRSHNAPSPLSDPGPLEDVDLSCPQQRKISGPPTSHDDTFDIQRNEASSVPKHCCDMNRETTIARTFTVDTDHPFKNDRPFRRWAGTLRQHRQSRTRSLTVREARWDLDDKDDDMPVKSSTSQRNKQHGHQKSSSWSAFGFVASVKAATSLPVSGTEDRSQKLLKKRFSKRTRNSTTSATTNSESTDARANLSISQNQAALERATQRRRLLDELLSSEESYVADLKVLLHVCNVLYEGGTVWWLINVRQVYAFILDSAPKIAQATQPGISQNIREMLCLHEGILLEITALITSSEAQKRSKHVRWQSVETIEGVIVEKAFHAVRRSLDIPWFGRSKQHLKTIAPREAANVAKVFERMVCLFHLVELPILE